MALRKRTINVTFEVLINDEEEDTTPVEVGTAVLMGFNTYLVRDANDAMEKAKDDPTDANVEEAAKRVEAVRHAVDPDGVEAVWLGDASDPVEIDVREHARMIRDSASKVLGNHLEKLVRRP